MPNPDYALLTEAITNTIHSMKLQNVTNFRKKILQLHEVINTRHGLMIVGQPFSGKTCCYRVLAGAYG
jgi:dynein heavy chain